MTELVKRFLSPIREFGFLSGLLYLVDRALGQVSSNLRLYYYELMAQPISCQQLVPARMTKALNVREIKRGDPELELMPVPWAIINSRFNQNAICLGAFKNDKFIGYIWFCFGIYEEDEVRCTYELTPKEESVFDFDLYLFPQNRLGLGFVGIWDGANRYLRNRKIRWTFSRVTRFNLASRRAHEHLGCKRVGRAFFLKAWRIEFMFATVLPYIGCTFRNSRRTRLQLRPDVMGD